MPWSSEEFEGEKTEQEEGERLYRQLAFEPLAVEEIKAELVTEEYLSEILFDLKEEHKELLFQCAVRQYSSTRIAVIRAVDRQTARYGTPC